MPPALALLLLLASVTPADPPGGGAVPAAETEDPTRPPADDPAAHLAALDARIAALPSLRYGVLRATHRGGARTEERWRHAIRQDGAFRVDYSGDTQRVLACDGHVLWDYVPASHAARRIRLDALDPAERKRILEGVLSKVAVPGFRTGVEAAGMSWRWEPPPSSAPAGAALAAGTDDTGGRIAILVGEDDRILSSEVRREGRFVISVVASEHRQVVSGVFLPTRLVVTAPDVGGEVRVDIRILQPVAGEALPDTLFHLAPDTSVRVEDVP
jgi:outer membrane lipoprotein-sorting protein